LGRIEEKERIHLPRDVMRVDNVNNRAGECVGDMELPELIRLRRDLHARPELKFEEHDTARRIIEFLVALALPVTSGIAGTGVVATIFGDGRGPGNAGRTIGLRADMDALPMQESNEFEHSSVYAGKMHACGHDGHIVMLLGAAVLLARRRDFAGTVHLIFQPGEEGGAGARRMIDEGLFERFPCDAVFALHNWPGLPVGRMGVRPGPIMAAGARFEICVVGRGGHAAQPHLTVDPISIACAIVGQLQTWVSRRIDPLDSAVVSITKIEAGESFNAIPERASISGTCRALRADVADRLHHAIRRVACLVAEAHDARAEVNLTVGYPCTENDPSAAAFMGQVMQEVVGETNVRLDVAPGMTSEDFSFMLQQVPGAYGFIGNGPVQGQGPALHSAIYDFNDGNLAIGPTFWNLLARRWFERGVRD
jgi:amidohydrolase